MENKDLIIAKFMGWVIDNSYPDKDRVYKNPNGGVELDTTFKFKQDWNSLMKVVDKIESLNFKVEICLGSCWIFKYDENGNYDDYENLVALYDSDSKIDAVYQSCICFIEYYNKNCA